MLLGVRRKRVSAECSNTHISHHRYYAVLTFYFYTSDLYVAYVNVYTSY